MTTVPTVTNVTSPRPRALVTGASRGIGAAIARALAPTHDVLLGGRDVRSLEAIAHELPGDAGPWVADLADPGALARATTDIDRLDVLVHNAAVTEPGTIADTSLDVWQRVFAVNLFSAAELTRLLLPPLRRGRGHVVLINAGSGLRITSHRGAYAASKYALRAFAETLQAEESPNGVRVTSIHPGPTDTELQRRAAERAGREYRPEQFLRPESVAAVVLNAVRAPADATVSRTVID
ncbi:SDR family oxidoreductase [Streptomyces sp. NPDC047085]|uniref:SDR family oxidoreductase n=1 Tax=Streptomyces sp. NPDC047085 TaxID=3155140 RepID=UPI0033EDC506